LVQCLLMYCKQLYLMLLVQCLLCTASSFTWCGWCCEPERSARRV
jgi:hypothetical protein